jgi:hypothetical protein
MVVFIILKLTEVITWSWWFILSPIWLGILFLFVAGAIKASLDD